MPNERTLAGPDVVEALKTLIDTHRGIHEGRIKRELHVVITTLTFFAAIVALRFYGHLPYSLPLNVIFCLAIVGLIIAVYIYMKSSGRSNRYNLKQAEMAEDRLVDALRESGADVKVNPDELKTAGYHPSDKRWLWQALTVIIGGILCGIIIFWPIN